jgi:hypothetical protein
LLLINDAGMRFRDATLSINEEGNREADRQSKRLLHHVEVAQHDRICDRVIGQMRVDGFPSFFIDGDAD